MQLKYFSEYGNRVDSFRLDIFQKDFTGDASEIEATCNLQTKEVDDAIATIRGTALKINILASVNNSFNEFFVINERFYKVKFYRNENQIFEGFIDPKGVRQPYVKQNWNISLLATDQLASLDNFRFKHDNEMPNEFTFLYLALKKTGLDLPFAFFDDTNLRKITGFSAVLQFDNEFWQDSERIIRPEVFINDNGRFDSCQNIVKDILQKYNFIIKQESIDNWVNLDGKPIKNNPVLCWCVYRVNSFKTSDSDVIGRIGKIVEVTGTTIKNVPPFNNVKTLVKLFYRGFKRVETTIVNDVEIGGNVPLNERPPHHVNANQEIGYEKALQNFRFEQRWRVLESWIDYDFNNFDFVSNFTPSSRYFEEDGKLKFIANSGFIFPPSSGLQTFDPLLPIDDQASAYSFLKYANIEVPQAAKNIVISGKGLITRSNLSTFNVLARMAIIVKQTAPSGNVYYHRIPAGNNNVRSETPFLTGNLGGETYWQLAQTITPDALDTLRMFHIATPLFVFLTNGDLEVNFNIELAPLNEEGGTFDLYLSDFRINTENGGDVADIQEWDAFNFKMDDLIFKVLGNPDNGIGEYHDQERKAFVTSNLQDPISVINADEVTNLYLNGLRQIRNGEVKNYDYWYMSGLQTDRLLNTASWERIIIKSQSQLVWYGDVYGFIPYFSWITLSDFPDKRFVLANYAYDTARNVTKIKLIEVPTGVSSFIAQNQINYENSYIFEDETNVLIDAD